MIRSLPHAEVFEGPEAYPEAIRIVQSENNQIGIIAVRGCISVGDLTYDVNDPTVRLRDDMNWPDSFTDMEQEPDGIFPTRAHPDHGILSRNGYPPKQIDDPTTRIIGFVGLEGVTTIFASPPIEKLQSTEDFNREVSWLSVPLQGKGAAKIYSDFPIVLPLNPGDIVLANRSTKPVHIAVHASRVKSGNGFKSSRYATYTL